MYQEAKNNYSARSLCITILLFSTLAFYSIHLAVVRRRRMANVYYFVAFYLFPAVDEQQ